MSYKKIKKTKLCMLILFLVIFSIILISNSDAPLIGLENFTSIDDLISKRSEDKNLIKGIVLNDIKCSYDQESNTFFFPTETLSGGKIIDLSTNILSNSNVGYIIDRNFTNRKMKYTVDFNKPVEILVYSNKKYATAYIQFTGLPIVDINTTTSPITYDSIVGDFRLIDLSKETNEIKSTMRINIRGQTSTQFPKKSYKLDLIRYKGIKTIDNNISLLGMYEDDDWVLDALYNDSSKIRNKLSSNLWNDINSSNQSKKIDNTLEAKFVEVFINNKYEGLYTLKEPINRENLNLNKTTMKDSGILLKIAKDVLPNFDNSTTDLITTDTYNRIEMKYPNSNVNLAPYWSSILSKINDYYDEKVENSRSVIEKAFYLENYIDYRLLNVIIGNSDGCGIRNTYLSMQSKSDSKVMMTPWDMDLTFGLMWDNFSSNTSVLNPESYNLFLCQLIETDDVEFINLLKKRYQELRSTVINMDIFNNYLDSYQTNLINSGAVNRDGNRWYDYNVEDEIDIIKEWFEKRLTFLDQYIGGL